MIPYKITFKDLAEKTEWKLYIEKRINKLNLFSHFLQHVDVIVTCPHRHQHDDRLFHVTVKIGMNGKDLVINRTPPADMSHTDPHVAVRDAFDAAERQLQERTKIIRHQVKNHHLRQEK